MHIVLHDTRRLTQRKAADEPENLTGSTGGIPGPVSPVWQCLTARRPLVRRCNRTRRVPLNEAWICESLPSSSWAGKKVHGDNCQFVHLFSRSVPTSKF
jgi:hypothetical protein